MFAAAFAAVSPQLVVKLGKYPISLFVYVIMNALNEFPPEGYFIFRVLVIVVHCR